MSEKRFELTVEHVALLRAANVRFFEGIEWGGPAFDFKRPFGNGNLCDDIDAIVGGHRLDRQELPPSRRARYETLYRELGTALQVVLASGSFKPGAYIASEYGFDWRAAA